MLAGVAPIHRLASVLQTALVLANGEALDPRRSDRRQCEAGAILLCHGAGVTRERWFSSSSAAVLGWRSSADRAVSYG
jgi:hypothetical protein